MLPSDKRFSGADLQCRKINDRLEIEPQLMAVDGMPQVSWEPVRMTKWQPQERKY